MLTGLAVVIYCWTMLERCSHQIGWDFPVFVGMVVSQGCVDLRKGEMPELLNNLLRDKSCFVPLRDTTHRNACACNAGTAAVNARVTLNEAANLCD